MGQFFLGIARIVPIQIATVAFLGSAGSAIGNTFARRAGFSGSASSAVDRPAAAVALLAAFVIAQRHAGFGGTAKANTILTFLPAGTFGIRIHPGCALNIANLTTQN